jgi:hypothetical protein
MENTTAKEFDVVGFIMDFEGGDITEAQIVEGMQYLINTGQAWSLQGFYGRTAEGLIEHGFCKPAGIWTHEAARDNFEEYLAERY